LNAAPSFRSYQGTSRLHHALKGFTGDTAESADLAPAKHAETLPIIASLGFRGNWKEHKKMCKSLAVGLAGVAGDEFGGCSSLWPMLSLQSCGAWTNENEDFKQFFKLFKSRSLEEEGLRPPKGSRLLVHRTANNLKLLFPSEEWRRP
jgi:hypothetical protein